MSVGIREVEKTTSTAAIYIDVLEIGGHFNEKNLHVLTFHLLFNHIYKKPKLLET